MRTPKNGRDALEKRFRQKLFKEIGSYLGRKRQEAGLTQAEIAQLSGYSAQFVSNIECGTAFPPPALMAQMIQGYQIPEHEFLDTLMQFQLRYYREVYFEGAGSKHLSRPQISRSTRS